MSDFSKEISDFQKNGTYDYVFDEGGNLVFNSSSSEFNQNYVSIPLLDYVYNATKINSFYDVTFKEFLPTVPTTVDTTLTSSSEVTQLTQENQDLRNKLDDLSSVSDANITDSERLAIKQIILGLRIQLKQGIADRDFSDTFPYLPLTKPTR